MFIKITDGYYVNEQHLVSIEKDRAGATIVWMTDGNYKQVKDSSFDDLIARVNFGFEFEGK